MSNKFDRIVDEKIREAIENGEFNHLLGAGKPIEWKDDPFTPDEMRLAYEILKNNNVSPPWIEKRKVIEEELANVISKFMEGAKVDLKTAEKKFIAQIDLINQKIIDYNLNVPISSLQRTQIDPQKLMLEKLSDRNK